MTQQPEALRLADRLDLYATGDAHQQDIEQAAAELRRLHDLCAEWERKAATWLASPEAAKRLDGYRELAQPEQEPVFDCPRCGHCCPQRTWVGGGDLEDSNAYLTPPQPEPVVYEDLATQLFVIAQTSPADDGFSDTIARIESWLREHFSTPPQRKPLTDEEIERACVPLGAAMLSFTEVARAIEAAHGIKGEA